MPKVAAVIPAGGVGARFGARTPKQFLRLGRLSILAATVRHFARHPAVRAVVVAAPESWVARARRILEPVVKDASLTVIAGGRTRQDSVWLALQAAPEDAEIVVVHDAVRPLITRHLIDAVVRAAAAEGAAICSLPITETVKRVRAARVEATLDRSELWAVQTPQAFPPTSSARRTRRRGATASSAPTTRCSSSASVTRCGWCVGSWRTSRSRRRRISAGRALWPVGDARRVR